MPRSERCGFHGSSRVEVSTHWSFNRGIGRCANSASTAARYCGWAKRVTSCSLARLVAQFHAIPGSEPRFGEQACPTNATRMKIAQYSAMHGRCGTQADEQSHPAWPKISALFVAFFRSAVASVAWNRCGGSDAATAALRHPLSGCHLATACQVMTPEKFIAAFELRHESTWHRRQL